MYRMSFYSHLSNHYDDIFPINPTQVAFLSSTFAGKKTILDIGAGTGTTAIALEKAGYSVTALEYDECMIEKIHEKTKQISIVNGDMRDLHKLFSSLFDAIYCVGNTLVHLRDKQEIQDVLSQCYSLLDDNGVLVLQIVNYNRVLSQNVSSLPTITVPSKSISFERGYSREGVHICFQGTLRIEDSEYTEKTLLYPLRKSEMFDLLETAGFTNISAFGSFKNDLFNDNESPALVITAQKAFYNQKKQ